RCSGAGREVGAVAFGQTSARIRPFTLAAPSRRRPQSFQSSGKEFMSTLGLIEYKDASPVVRAVYDDIMATRKTDWINNFWKAIAHDPATLKRTWEDIKQIMPPGALDPLTKEMIYVSISVSNQCNYCIASHTASA